MPSAKASNVSVVDVRGVQLEVHDDAGNGGSESPLFLLHGFTGSATTWRRFTDAGSGVRCIAPSILGHGASDAPDDAARYSMANAVADLVAVLDVLDIDRAAVLGYSMGGRIGMRLALRHPSRVRALILESASPGIESGEERAARRRADEGLADRIEAEGVESFVDFWEALPLWATQAELPTEARTRIRAQRLGQRAVGLANSLRGIGAGCDAPVLDDLRRLDIPTLVIAGALDARYAALAEAIAARVPNAELRIVEGAGHAVHLEAPDAFASAVRTFMHSLRS